MVYMLESWHNYKPHSNYEIWYIFNIFAISNTYPILFIIISEIPLYKPWPLCLHCLSPLSTAAEREWEREGAMAITAVSRWTVTGAAAQKDQPHFTTSSSRVQFGSINFRSKKQLRLANATIYDGSSEADTSVSVARNSSRPPPQVPGAASRYLHLCVCGSSMHLWSDWWFLCSEVGEG